MRNKNGVFITAILVFFGGLTVFLIMDNERPVIDPNPQTIEGTYVCLPHRGVLPGEPTTGECAFGLKAEDGGDYYAVRLNDPSQGIFDLYPGDQISVHGFLSEIRPGDELYRYESDVLISADQKVKRILHLSGDRLYSSPRAAVEIIVDTPQADKSGYVILYQSNFSGRREFIKVPVNFE